MSASALADTAPAGVTPAVERKDEPSGVASQHAV